MCKLMFNGNEADCELRCVVCMLKEMLKIHQSTADSIARIEAILSKPYPEVPKFPSEQ